jgi:hypothetical protein
MATKPKPIRKPAKIKSRKPVGRLAAIEDEILRVVKRAAF